MKQCGRFVTIEGIEGAGKSTVLKFVMNTLGQHGIDVVASREPGGTDVAEAIRNILLQTNVQEAIDAKTELLLMFAGRMQHIRQVIIPTLKSGRWLVSDRYVDASYAYQGGGRGISLQAIKMIDDFVVDGLYPELTLLLDLPVELGFERTKKRKNGPDRIEKEKIDFFERVREVYLARAKQYPGRIKIVDASKDLNDVKTQIKQILEEFI